MLYICATPIGNLADISLRAIDVLNQSDIILCEDTRNSLILLNHHNIKIKKLVALHQHNEEKVSVQVVKWLEQGLIISQISDAGTPGISDPGARLCAKVLDSGLKISPIPGACAYLSLLSVSGINVPHIFLGFLAAKTRIRTFKEYQTSAAAIIIYESPHRIISCLNDIKIVFGATANIILGRELTKKFETIIKDQVENILVATLADSKQQKGEFVIIILPVPKISTVIELNSIQKKALTLLLAELAPTTAVKIAHQLVGGEKELLYQYAITLK